MEEFGKLLQDLSSSAAQRKRLEEEPAPRQFGNAAGGSWDPQAFGRKDGAQDVFVQNGTDPSAGTVPAERQSQAETSLLKESQETDPAQSPDLKEAGQEAAQERKAMSLLYLMQHYNKQNAAEYKAGKSAQKQAQKDEKERKKQEKKQRKQEKTEKKKKPKTSRQEASPAAGMAIPSDAGQNGSAAALPGMMQKESAAAVSGMPQQGMMEIPSGASAHAAAGATGARPAGKMPISAEFLANDLPRIPKSRQAATPSGRIPQTESGAKNFGETTVLTAKAGETTVLAESRAQGGALRPYLLRQNTGEKIAVSKSVFRIGKEPEFADYLIADNPAVSRSHANFLVKNGCCYVTDTNSTNHTYVNGAMIQSNLETNLGDGDLVRLANEEFQFRML